MQWSRFVWWVERFIGQYKYTGFGYSINLFSKIHSFHCTILILHSLLKLCWLNEQKKVECIFINFEWRWSAYVYYLLSGHIREAGIPLELLGVNIKFYITIEVLKRCFKSSCLWIMKKYMISFKNRIEKMVFRSTTKKCHRFFYTILVMCVHKHHFKGFL